MTFGAAILIVGTGLATEGEGSGGGVARGMGGRFGSLKGVVGDGLTAHHMPQAKLNFTSFLDGGALVMTDAEHAATRTFRGRGIKTARADAGRPFRAVLADDIKDVKSIVGKKYNEGIKDVISYYKKNFPEFMKKDR